MVQTDDTVNSQKPVTGPVNSQSITSDQTVPPEVNHPIPDADSSPANDTPVISTFPPPVHSKNPLLLLALLVIVLVAVPVTYLLVRQNQDLRQRAFYQERSGGTLGGNAHGWNGSCYNPGTTGCIAIRNLCPQMTIAQWQAGVACNCVNLGNGQVDCTNTPVGQVTREVGQFCLASNYCGAQQLDIDCPPISTFPDSFQSRFSDQPPQCGLIVPPTPQPTPPTGPCNPGEWGTPQCGGLCDSCSSAHCTASGTWECLPNPGLCCSNPEPTPPTTCTSPTTAEVNVNSTGWTTNNIIINNGDSVQFRANPINGRTALFNNSANQTMQQCSSDPAAGGACPGTRVVTGAPGTIYRLVTFEFVPGQFWNPITGCADSLRIQIAPVVSIPTPPPTPQATPLVTPSITPIPTPIPTPTPLTSPTPVATPVVSPTPTPTPGVGGPVCGTTCTLNSQCPSNMICLINAGQTTGVCRNPACSSNTDCICTPTVYITTTPTPEVAVIPQVPAAGNLGPTIMLLLGGATLLILGLVIL